MLFLDGRSIYIYIYKIKVNDGERRQLVVDNILKQSSTLSTVPVFCGWMRSF